MSSRKCELLLTLPTLGFLRVIQNYHLLVGVEAAVGTSYRGSIMSYEPFKSPSQDLQNGICYLSLSRV